MAAELIIVPEAEQDLAEAYAWYEGRQIGLGEESLSCVEAVFYEHVEGTVTVYGVFHTSRDPDKWRQCPP
jgi:hypothetical protein